MARKKKAPKAVKPKKPEVTIKRSATELADDWFVVGWRKAYKWFSMQAMAFDAALLAVWATIPDDLKSGLPGWLVPSAAMFVLIVGMFGRLTNQEPPKST